MMFKAKNVKRQNISIYLQGLIVSEWKEILIKSAIYLYL